MKQKIRKVFSTILFILGLVAPTISLLTLFLPKEFTSVIAIVIICISIAFGILMPPIYPLALLALLIGVMLLVFPKLLSSIVLMILGISLIILFIILAKKSSRSVSA